MEKTEFPFFFPPKVFPVEFVSIMKNMKNLKTRNLKLEKSSPWHHAMPSFFGVSDGSMRSCCQSNCAWIERSNHRLRSWVWSGGWLDKTTGRQAQSDAAFRVFNAELYGFGTRHGCAMGVWMKLRNLLGKYWKVSQSVDSEQTRNLHLLEDPLPAFAPKRSFHTLPTLLGHQLPLSGVWCLWPSPRSVRHDLLHKENLPLDMVGWRILRISLEIVCRLSLVGWIPCALPAAKAPFWGWPLMQRGGGKIAKQIRLSPGIKDNFVSQFALFKLYSPGDWWNSPCWFLSLGCACLCCRADSILGPTVWSQDQNHDPTAILIRLITIIMITTTISTISNYYLSSSTMIY